MSYQRIEHSKILVTGGAGFIGPNRAGDIPHSLASIEKAKTLLNYNPSHVIDAGVKEAVEWYWKYL